MLYWHITSEQGYDRTFQKFCGRVCNSTPLVNTYTMEIEQIAEIIDILEILYISYFEQDFVDGPQILYRPQIKFRKSYV